MQLLIYCVDWKIWREVVFKSYSQKFLWSLNLLHKKLCYTFSDYKFKTTLVIVSVDSTMNVPLLSPFLL